MPDISVQDIQALRHEAGVGMMDAKNALVESGGDSEAALELLRERGMIQVSKRAERSAHHGTLGHYIHLQQGRAVAGVLVDLACETDFVAKSDEFVAIADDIAMHISWGNPLWVDRDEADQSDLVAKRQEFEAEARDEGKPEDLIGKIVEGKIQKYLSDASLNEQVYVNPDRFDGTVGEMVRQLAAKMGENISVRQFSRISVGEDS